MQKSILKKRIAERVGDVHTIKNPANFCARCVVDSIDKFNDVLNICQEYYKDKGYDTLCFRGQKCANWELTPSIARYKGFQKYELEILKALLRNMNSQLCTNSIFIAQHYGFPTRLLDVTKDSNVALWFACDSLKKHNGKEHDGEVIVMPYRKLQDSIITDFNIWQINNYEDICSKSDDEVCLMFNRENNSNFSKYDLYYCHHCYPWVIEYEEELCNIYEGRISNQDAAGIMVPLRFNEKSKSNKQAYSKLFTSELVSIKIAGTKKSQILRDLDKRKINEKYLFENDLEHLSNYVKSKYLQKIKEKK